MCDLTRTHVLCLRQSIVKRYGGPVGRGLDGARIRKIANIRAGRGAGGAPSLSDLEILVTCLSVDGPRRIYNCPVRARRRARARDPLSLVISVRDRASARTVTVHGVHADGTQQHGAQI